MELSCIKELCTAQRIQNDTLIDLNEKTKLKEIRKDQIQCLRQKKEQIERELLQTLQDKK